jgi:hypothetical protein
VRHALRWAPAGVALALVAVVFAPTDLRAFAVLGFSLPQSVRDVRVFNNFTSASANDNQVADPSWPGARGAVLAIWKGCAEWCSELHDGTGAGDPHQPGGVGASGSNFEISWQGLATSVGGLGDRVHSEISGSNPGVYAFTEGPLGGPWNNGWRIRYYQAWTWNDGPDATLPANHVDLQGVACHEHGHALGLGHSNVSTATMWAFVIGNGVDERSIEADDRAGVQQVYGVFDPLVKPHLDTLTLTGGVVTLTGSNFAASANEIWFTQAGPAATGTPVKVTGLASNGSVLTAPLPSGVGPGDVLVKKGGLTGPKGLSNALAFDPWSCAAVSTYCTAGQSSNGCIPVLSAQGSPNVAASSGFTLQATNVEGNRSALFFYGNSGRAASPWAPGSTSYLCLQAPFQRTLAQSTGGNAASCDGACSLDWRAWLAANPTALGNPLTAGTVFQAQLWYRDPAAPKSTNLSGALEFTACP